MAKEKVIRYKKGVIQDWGEAILWAFVVAMLIRNYTFQNFKIPSESMQNTLLVGDYLVANKLKYLFTDPKRGDIVTFRSPDDPIHPADSFRIITPIYWNYEKNKLVWHEKKNIVKRVIGMPGDTIEILNKKVYINGTEQDYTVGKELLGDEVFSLEGISNIYKGKRIGHQLHKDFIGSRDNIKAFNVPEGHYFVMGDNRDNSLDSRFWGFLDRKDITGTPAVIFFSLDGWKLRFDRMFKKIT